MSSPSEVVRFMENQNEINQSLREEISSIKSILIEVKTVGILTHEQTKKTNGRVNRLEAFRNFLLGGAATIGVIWSIVTWVIPYFRTDTLSNKDFEQVQAFIKSKSLESYEKNINY